MKLAERVPHLTVHDLHRHFWNGSATYLQREWVRIGLDPEDANTTKAAMLESGMCFERAASWESAEAKRTSHKNTHAPQVATADWRPTDYFHEDVSEKSSNSSREDESQEESEDSDESRSEESSDSIQEDESQEETESEEGSDECDKRNKRLTEAKKAQLRAEGRCFQCQMRGHIVRDCPERQKATPSRNTDQGETVIFGGALNLNKKPSKRSREPVMRLNCVLLRPPGEQRPKVRKKCEERDINDESDDSENDEKNESAAEDTDSPELEEKAKGARERPQKSVLRTTPEAHKPLTDSRASVVPALSAVERPARSERQAAKADKRPPRSSTVAKLPKETGKPPPNDHETIVTTIGMAGDEGGLDKSPLKTAANAPIPTIPSPSPSTIPTPPSTRKPERMNRRNRNFKSATDSPTPLRVQRTRDHTPHPYPRTMRFAQAYDPGNDKPDAIDIAVATATAGTTPSVAKEVRLAIAARTKTADERAKLVTEIERNPAKFYHYIGMSDILKRILNSVNHETARASGSRPATTKSKAPKPAKGQAPAVRLPEPSPELINLFRDLIYLSQINNAILTSQYQTPASSNALKNTKKK